MITKDISRLNLKQVNISSEQEVAVCACQPVVTNHTWLRPRDCKIDWVLSNNVRIVYTILRYHIETIRALQYGQFIIHPSGPTAIQS